MVHLDLRNESSRKGLARRDVLLRLAERICAAEGAGDAVEVSVMLCDDLCITELNRTYRKKNKATDVLSFAQTATTFRGAQVLGDIVISLETVERFCAGERAAMRAEIRLLFCHGLLHLLGYDHADASSEMLMNTKQADFLGVPVEAAWHRKKRARA